MRELLRCGVASLAIMAGGSAAAQGMPPSNGPKTGQVVDDTQTSQDGSAPDIVVTGVRASLNSATAIKRNAGAIVDSIVAEDIGKLPDNNVAESLQRITGVQITRNNGQGRGIAIRGLSQVQTLLDGREIFTSNGRSLTVADIPADLVGGIDVYKTSQADQIEGGLGGTVDIRLRRALDFKGFELGVSARGEYTDKLKQVKPYVSALVSNRWETGVGDVGVLLSASYQDFAYRVDRNAIGTFSERLNLYDRDGDGVFPNDRGDLIVSPTDVGQNYNYGSRKQTGLNGSLQWAPSAALELHLDGLYTRFDSRQTNQLLYALTGNSGIRNSPAVAAPPFEFAEDGLTISRGRWTNAKLTAGALTQDDLTETYQIAAGGKYEMDGVTLTGDFSYSDSRSGSTYSELSTGGVAPVYDLDLRDFLPRISVTGVDPTDINQFGIERLTWNNTRAKGDQIAGRLDARFEIGDRGLTTLKLGVRYADRNARSATIEANVNPATPIAASRFPQLFELTDNDNFPGDNLAIRQWLIPTTAALRDYVGLRQTLGLPTALPTLVPTAAYVFGEKTMAFYAKGEFLFDLFSIPIDGNVGMRVIRTQLRGDSAIALSGAFLPVSQRNSYVDALPSVNVRARFTDNLFLRGAASKSLTRPSFGSLNPALRLDPLFLQGSAGNPNLQPLRADQYDVSLEWYLPRGGLLYAAGFYKKVRGFVQNIIAPETIGGLTYLVSRPQNGQDGTIKGFEAGYQQFFDFLPGALSGLGFQGNYTYVDSAAPSAVVGQTVPLQNLSRHSYNLVGIYEKYGFSARVAYNWRSAFVNTTSGGGAGGLPIYTNAQPQLDASLAYDVTSRIAITLDAQNLTRPRRRDYYGVFYRPKSELVQDRRFQMGFRVRL